MSNDLIYNCPVVIMPFYGEYGYYITNYIRRFHTIQAPEKIICCKKGEELFFPSANAFYYEWKELYQDSEKCGLRNEWPINPNPSWTKEELFLKEKLGQLYPNSLILRLTEALYPQEGRKIKILINDIDYSIKGTDIVVCSRKRQASHPLADQGRRNFQHWPYIIDELKKYNLTISVVGRPETSYFFDDKIVYSWQFADPTKAMVSLLKQCKLYLSTDTGPTHLAALLNTPMITFRYEGDGSPNMINEWVKPFVTNHFQFLPNVWNKPGDIVDAILNYFKK